MVPHAAVGPNRWRIGFREAVLSSFAFLERLGFSPVMEEPTLVRYESGRAFVNVYHGRASFELGVEIGRREEPGRVFDLSDAAAIVAPGDEVAGGGAALTREEVEKFVSRLELQAETYLVPLFARGPAAFEHLDRVDTARRQRYWHEMDVRNARSAAESARMSKDYPAMVRAYEAIEPELTAVERKRIAYARSKLDKAG